MRGGHTFSYPAFADLHGGNPGVFTGIAARYQDGVDVARHGPPVRAYAELVSGNYFDVLGVTAAIGRTLTPDDDRTPGTSPYVVLSYQYWSRRFGDDPSILNTTIYVNGQPMTVVGVAQRAFPGFALMTPADLFVPLSMKKVVTPTWGDRARRDSVWLLVFAGLSPGVTPGAAQATPWPFLFAARSRTTWPRSTVPPISPGAISGMRSNSPPPPRATITYSSHSRGRST